MASSPVQIKSPPGIMRDGTMLAGTAHVDGQWVRWQRQLPRKIGGYRSINKFLTTLPRTISEYTQDLLTYIHTGSATKVERFYIDDNGNTSIVSDRTPVGLVASPNNMWQFDVMFQGGATNLNQLLAHVAPNLASIANSQGGQLFYGDVTAGTALTAVNLAGLGAGSNVSGGVVVLHPYTFVFGANGYLAWCVAGDPTNFTGAGSGAANVTSQKLIRGLPLRGGPGNSPSGLFWSSDAVIRASFVGGTDVFQFDTIAGRSSILSAQSVIEYDGIYYWVGTDRFLSFNGVIREVPNDKNLNWFFDGLNYEQRQKVFAYKVPRYGEIWWCFPRGSALEPTHAVVYNVREGSWYDTELPNSGRGAGISPSVYPKPFMTGVAPDPSTSGYQFWVHESGVDEIDGASVQPILSYFETGDISLPVEQQANKALRVALVEPDFVQTGPLIMQIRGRSNARSPEVAGPLLTIPETASVPGEQVTYLKEQRRQMRFRFTSNVIGGDYQMGLVLAHIGPSDGTVIG